MSGSIEVSYDNGWIKKKVRLDRPDQGFLVRNAAWRQVKRLSKNAVVLVLTSQGGRQEEAATPTKDFNNSSYLSQALSDW